MGWRESLRTQTHGLRWWVEIGPVVLEEIFIFRQCILLFCNYLHLEKGGPVIWQTWIFITQGFFVPISVEIGSVVLENKISKFCQCIFTISYLSPLEKGKALHLNKLDSPSPKSAKFCWNQLCGFWEEDFKISSMYSCYFVIISPWKKAGPFILSL